MESLGGVEPQDSPLRNLLPGQCVLFAHEHLFQVQNASKLFVNDIYVRLTAPQFDTFTHFIGVKDEGTQV